jgi:hypothetical protein
VGPPIADWQLPIFDWRLPIKPNWHPEISNRQSRNPPPYRVAVLTSWLTAD